MNKENIVWLRSMTGAEVDIGQTYCPRNPPVILKL
jgi:hypothetical protein